MCASVYELMMLLIKEHPPTTPTPSPSTLRCSRWSKVADFKTKSLHIARPGYSATVATHVQHLIWPVHADVTVVHTCIQLQPSTKKKVPYLFYSNITYAKKIVKVFPFAQFLVKVVTYYIDIHVRCENSQIVNFLH